MDEKNEYQNLNNIPVLSEKTGKEVLRYAGVGTLFLSNTDHRKAPAISDMADAYLSVFSRAVTRFRKANGRELPIVGDNWRHDFENAIPEDDYTLSFNLDLFAEGVIPPFRLDVFAPYDLDNPNLKSKYGRCRFHMPLTWLKSNRSDFVAHLQQWCSHLKPEQGSFGIGLVSTPGMERQRTVEAWPSLARFSGLDHATNIDWSARKPHAGLRAVNWLTVLDDVWVETLGGRDAIAGALHPEGRVHDYRGGIIVQACTHPQMGDINMHGVPEAYVAVDKLIAPHRYVDYPDKPMHLFKVPPPLDPHVTTLGWLRRFEEAT
ncbi:uncharacterized protein DUF3396 [Yoonia maricola]|uniref:Uncharacterized protein DUF3396 n=1 Tax=Yoonia maricola TaxID=420999 RepID=A0A2M8W0B1_9RHOB|nr:type VI immunity family protein [Yoonia maricola]PJI84355.1 uncharacterized protein DUF3396 [Yoonia maricola]